MLTKELSWYRGDKTDFSFVVTGDHTARKLRFVVKADKTITGDRLIEKKNTLFGGSDAELEAAYSSTTGKTTITVHILEDDNSDFANSKYYFDIVSISNTDPDDTETIVKGTINNNFDVQTDYDGTNLPSSATRYVNLDASEAEVGDMVQCQLVGGVKTFVLITIADLKTQLGIE